VTEKVPDDIADANDSDVVDTVSELAVVPACDTDTVRVMPPPVTVTVAVRAVVPVFALVAFTVIVALLEPEVGETVIQL